MKAVIMAGGEGTRLRPITCTKPKPMAPLLNKPIVDYTMDLLKKHGFDEAVFTLRYMASEIERHIGAGTRWGIKTEFSDPGRKIGTAGSVRNAVSDLREPLLVLSGDGITDVDLAALMREHESSGAAATVVLTRVDEPTEYGVALLDGDGFIERFIEKPERSEVFSDYANTGIYVLSPEAVELIPKDKSFDFSKDLFPLMMKKGLKLLGHRTNAYWCDVGDIAQYRRAQLDMLEGRCKFETIARKVDGVFIEPNAHIADTAELIAPCYIGSGAIIGEGARIGAHSVVGCGAAVDSEASLKRSIVFENAYVGAGAELREAVVCERARIGRGASLFSGSVIGAGSEVGAGVTVLPSVGVWPGKHIEAGGQLERNLIWGESAPRAEFIGGRVTGDAALSLTPETALRLGAAFASSLKKEKAAPRIAVSTDGGPASVMLKHALIAGIVSTGADASDVQPLAPSAFGYTLAHSGFDGGVYIGVSDVRGAELRFLDDAGFECEPSAIRELRSVFMRGEQRPALETELGLASSVNGLEEAYEHRLSSLVDKETMMNNKRTLRISGAELTSKTLARVLLRLGWEVEGVRERVLSPSSDDKTLAVCIDEDEMLSLSIGTGVTADAQLILTVLAMRAAEKGEKTLVLPFSLHEAYREKLETETLGCETFYVRDDVPSLMRESKKHGTKAALYEPEAVVMQLCELFADGSLERRLDELPRVFSKEATLKTSWRSTGRLLRALTEGERGSGAAELVDGLRLKCDTGWVLIRPTRSSTAAFRIVAGSMNSEYASELCDMYLDRLKKLNERETTGETAEEPDGTKEG